MEKYDGVLKELAALLVPHLIAHPDVQLLLGGATKLATVEYVDRKMDELSQLDKHAIADMVRAELENAELVTGEDLDDRLTDYIPENTAEEKLQEIFTDNISDAVRECLKREITLTVEVS
jgi:hypothetical protein